MKLLGLPSPLRALDAFSTILSVNSTACYRVNIIIIALSTSRQDYPSENQSRNPTITTPPNRCQHIASRVYPPEICATASNSTRRCANHDVSLTFLVHILTISGSSVPVFVLRCCALLKAGKIIRDVSCQRWLAGMNQVVEELFTSLPIGRI